MSDTNRGKIRRAGIITVSDTCSQGLAEDTSGHNLQRLITSNDLGFKCVVVSKLIVPDEFGVIKSTLLNLCDSQKCDLVLTTGGTGFSPRDITPEATRAVIERDAPGMATAMLMESLKITPMAMLSRPVCGIRGNTLIANFPGSKKASEECLKIISPALPHAMDLLSDRTFSVAETHRQVQGATAQQPHWPKPSPMLNYGNDRSLTNQPHQVQRRRTTGQGTSPDGFASIVDPGGREYSLHFSHGQRHPKSVSRRKRAVPLQSRYSTAHSGCVTPTSGDSNIAKRRNIDGSVQGEGSVNISPLIQTTPANKFKPSVSSSIATDERETDVMENPAGNVSENDQPSASVPVFPGAFSVGTPVNELKTPELDSAQPETETTQSAIETTQPATETTRSANETTERIHTGAQLDVEIHPAENISNGIQNDHIINSDADLEPGAGRPYSLGSSESSTAGVVMIGEDHDHDAMEASDHHGGDTHAEEDGYLEDRPLYGSETGSDHFVEEDDEEGDLQYEGEERGPYNNENFHSGDHAFGGDHHDFERDDGEEEDDGVDFVEDEVSGDQSNFNDLSSCMDESNAGASDMGNISASVLGSDSNIATDGGLTAGRGAPNLPQLCHICQRLYTQRRSWANHMKIKHPEWWETYQAESRLATTDKLVDKAAGEPGRFTFDCSICGKKHNRRHTLMRHMQHHTGPSFVCQLCRKGYYNQVSLRRHQTRGCQPRPRPGYNTPTGFACSRCLVRFITTDLLAEHEQLHCRSGRVPLPRPAIGFTGPQPRLLPPPSMVGTSIGLPPVGLRPMGLPPMSLPSMGVSSVGLPPRPVFRLSTPASMASTHPPPRNVNMFPQFPGGVMHGQRGLPQFSSQNNLSREDSPRTSHHFAASQGNPSIFHHGELAAPRTDSTFRMQSTPQQPNPGLVGTTVFNSPTTHSDGDIVSDMLLSTPLLSATVSGGLLGSSSTVSGAFSGEMKSGLKGTATHLSNHLPGTPADRDYAGSELLTPSDILARAKVGSQDSVLIDGPKLELE